VTRQARCQCGGVRIACEGEPVRVSVCHCFDCQRRSGSAFAAQARFPRSRVQLAGETREFVRIADSGRRAFQSFCPTCGTGVAYYLEDAPELLAIPLGLFADPAFPQPAFSVWESRKHPWVTIPGERVEHRQD
jgi:hypothetical protein